MWRSTLQKVYRFITFSFIFVLWQHRFHFLTFRASFFFIFVFSKQARLNKIVIDWIRTLDHWCQKRLIYQLCHNLCQLLYIVWWIYGSDLEVSRQWLNMLQLSWPNSPNFICYFLLTIKTCISVILLINKAMYFWHKMSIALSETWIPRSDQKVKPKTFLLTSSDIVLD